VLADQEIHDNLKFYADWPTFPQLYLNGQLIGGSDIMKDLYEKGELQKLIELALE
jgi:monothiol glutaredoxin